MTAACRAALAAAAFMAAASGAAWSVEREAVRSLLEARHQNVVIQEWDSSCGAAALATVLRFQLGDPVSERSVAVGMLRGIDPDRVRSRGGFSLLDMKRYAQSRGFEADGYAGLTRGQLLRLAPAIVPVRSHGGDHFVVFRGVVNGQAVLADPAFGNRNEPFAQFEAKWKDRLAFVVKVPGKRGNRLQPTKRDLLRVGDEAARADEPLPRPLADAQLAVAFAVDRPSAPPASPLVPIASPDNASPRGPSPGMTAPATPGPPIVSTVTSPATSPGISSPVPVGTSTPTLPPTSATIAAPLLPPITITTPVTIPAATISPPTLPPLPLPLTLPPGR